MSRSNKEERFAEDLQGTADTLRDQRPMLDPLALDRIKLRAMRGARSNSSLHKGFHMRSRLTTLLAAGFLAAGAGGAFALNGGIGGGASHPASASFNQYCEHGKGRGHDHECHHKDKKDKKDKKGKKDKGKGKAALNPLAGLTP
jgi:hypothetical protein